MQIIPNNVHYLVGQYRPQLTIIHPIDERA